MAEYVGTNAGYHSIWEKSGSGGESGTGLKTYYAFKYTPPDYTRTFWLLSEKADASSVDDAINYEDIDTTKPFAFVTSFLYEYNGANFNLCFYSTSFSEYLEGIVPPQTIETMGVCGEALHVAQISPSSRSFTQRLIPDGLALIKYINTIQ